MAISHCFWHLVVKNGNFTLLLTSSGQEWQFHIASDIQWSRMAISQSYRHMVVKNGNFTLLLTCSGQEWQFTLLLTSSGQQCQFLVRSFICNMKRPSMKQSTKQQVSSNFQIYLGKTDRPAQYQTFMTTLQMKFSDLAGNTDDWTPPVSYCNNSCTALHAIYYYDAFAK